MLAVVLVALVAIAIARRPTRAWIRRDLAPAIDRFRSHGNLAGFSNLVRVARPTLAR
jgi:hypothetical protein